MDSREPLEVARAALRVGNAEGARRALDAAEVCAEVWELRGAASFIRFEYARSADEYEQAYADYQVRGDGAGAVRVARTLGCVWGTGLGSWAVASGWVARAKTLLTSQPTSIERGWVALAEGMFSADRGHRHASFREAIEVGRSGDEHDLTLAALAYLGASLVHGDHVQEGMGLLDEALAAVLGGEVDDFLVIEEIFCQMFSACEHAHDVQRAEQWIWVGEQVAARRGLPSVAAYCRTHYGGIMTAAGRWPEADAALTEGVRLWTLSRRTLRTGALTRLADLRIRQGRYEEAAILLEGLDQPEALPSRAALHLAQGEARVALELLEHAVETGPVASTSAIPLLSLLVEAQVACGEDAQSSVESLATCARAHPSPYANAVLALARARAVRDDRRRRLRDAVEGFTLAQLPLEAALCRLELAAVCRKSDPEVALSEARRALSVFRRLAANSHAAAAGALLRELGHPVPPPRPTGGTLTHREDDILRLLGEGLSNPQIAQRLFLSRKTVEHHVASVLSKLGLHNRAEATAYAVRRGFAAE